MPMIYTASRYPATSSCKFWPVGFLWEAPIYPFEHVAKLSGRYRHSAVLGSWPYEASAFEPLREQTRALPIVPDHFDQIAALATKHEQMPAMRIGFQRFLYLQREAWKTAPPLKGLPSGRISVCPVASHTRTPAGTGITTAPRARR